jgi:hypothetical protein
MIGVDFKVYFNWFNVVGIKFQMIRFQVQRLRTDFQEQDLISVLSISEIRV